MKVCMKVRYCQTDFDEIWYEDGAELEKGHTILFIAKNKVVEEKERENTIDYSLPCRAI